MKRIRIFSVAMSIIMMIFVLFSTTYVKGENASKRIKLVFSWWGDKSK